MPSHSYLKGRTHFDKTGAQFAWDSTSMKLAYECPRKYFYTMLHDWADPGKSVHLIFGGHYARALETYHKLRITEGYDHDDAVRFVVRQTLIESWVHNTDSEGKRIPDTGHPQQFDSTSKTREGLIRTIIWYLEEHKTSDFATYTKADGTPAVELSFKLEIENDIILCGHLDRVVEYDVSTLFVQDQKSTGSVLSQYYFRQFDLDIQMSNYSFVGRAIFNAPIKGVMIDAAHVASGYSTFMRGFTYRSQDQLDEFYEGAMRQIALIQNMSRRYADNLDESVFPQNFTACGNYGGCPFKTVCTTRRGDRDKFLRANFQKRDMWNPLIER
jgi:hypothetical protein